MKRPWWNASAQKLHAPMQPENLYFKIAQAKLMFREKAYNECIDVCKVITARDTIPEILSMTGDAFRYIGRTDSALVYYDRFLAIKPLHAKTVSRKADILLAEKKHDEVLQMTGAFLEKKPDDMTVLPIHGLALHLSK